MKDIRYVYFDLDDTLLDHTHAEKVALHKMISDQPDLFGNHPHDVIMQHYRAINPIVWRKYASGEFTKEQAKIGRFEELLEACNPQGRSKASELAQLYLDTYANHWKEVDGAFDAYKETASSVPVGILTNGFSEVQRAKLRQFSELEQAAHSIVISEDVGHLKPSPILFKHAAELAGVEAENILYVGDSFSSDVEGGTAAGWKVAWYSESLSDHPDVWSFSSWAEFRSIIPLFRA